MPVSYAKLLDRHEIFLLTLPNRFAGRVRPSGCPTDIKKFPTMPVSYAKLLDRHGIFFYIYT